MQQSRSAVKRKEIVWRQEKVLDMAGDGFSEREIAKRLQISDTTIHRDLVILRQQAKDQIHKYIDEQVPFEYQKTLTGLQGIIKSMANIIINSTDSREIMQASAIKMQAYNMKMELVSNANLVEEAINLVERYRGYTQQKDKVRIDNGTEQPT